MSKKKKDPVIEDYQNIINPDKRNRLLKDAAKPILQGDGNYLYCLNIKSRVAI